MRVRVLFASWLLCIGFAVMTPAAAEAKRSCKDTLALPAEVGAARTAATTLCLINQERTARGLKPLKANGALRTASVAHARDMVANHLLQHESVVGEPFVDRILRTRYLVGPVSDVLLGENLAWGSGRRAAPGQIVRAWMRSPEHRANILQPAFRHVGIAVAEGTPSPAAPLGATFTAAFGTREKS